MPQAIKRNLTNPRLIPIRDEIVFRLKKGTLLPKVGELFDFEIGDVLRLTDVRVSQILKGRPKIKSKKHD